jgi:uncharacterized protein (TIGR02147 family)
MGAKANRKVLRQCLEALDVTSFTEPAELLKTVYQAAKAKILDYTLLQFAEDLGFGQSPQLRMMMSGQRSLTVKAARKVADSLWIHGSARHYFLNLVEFTNARRPEDRERLLKAVASWKYKAAARPVDERVSQYLSHWLNPVIRELVASGHVSSDVEDIRGVLNFPVLPAEVRAALDLLLELKMLRYVKGSAALAPTGGDVVTEAEVDALGAVVYHQAMIGIAKESITRVPPESREITGITLSLPPEVLPEIKAKTQEFLDFIQSLEARSGQKRDVFQVNVQVFPFTTVKS